MMSTACACATDDHDEWCQFCGSESSVLTWIDEGFRVCKSGCARQSTRDFRADAAGGGDTDDEPEDDDCARCLGAGCSSCLGVRGTCF
jgi:hypothetical protein